MDPVSIIGLVGTLVGLGDVVARSVGNLVNLQSKFRASSLVVSLLIGQLTTIKAALNHIKEWIEGSLSGVPLNGQLVAELSVSLESCHMLIFVLGERIENLEKDQSGLTMKGKFGFLLEQGDLNEFTNHLNNQVNALNLFLTALYCRTAFECNELLGCDESQRIIKQVKDNKSSLLSLRDAESQYTKMTTATENWNLLDREFLFDQEVITTDVYRQALRSNMKKATSNSKEKVVLRADYLVNVETERAEEEPRSNEESQPASNEMIFLQQDLQEELSVSGPLVEEQEAGRGFVLEMEDTDNLMGHRRRQYGEHSAVTPLQAQAKIIEVAKKSSVATRTSFIGQHSQNEQIASTTSPILQISNSNSATYTKRLSIQRTRITTKFLNRPLDSGKKFNSDWRLRIPKIFTTPSNPNTMKSLASTHSQSSPSEQLASTHSQSSPSEQLKILLLGTSESGKTTVLKSLTACQGSKSWSLEERIGFKEVIFSNTITSMRVLLIVVESLEIPLDVENHDYYVQTVFSQHPTIKDAYLSQKECLPQEMCDAVDKLWREDTGVRQAFERRREYQLNDAAQYFFESVKRFTDINYIPNDKDILMARLRTTSYTSTESIFQGFIAKIFDVGGTRVGRKKWIHIFENVSDIIFTVDIACWDQLLEEDETVNRMQEALLVFDSIVNSRWFIRTRFILVFTKMDKLKAKLKKGDIKTYFPDFSGDETSVKDTCTYIENRFLSLNMHKSKHVEVVYTSFIGGGYIPGKKILDTLVAQIRNEGGRRASNGISLFTSFSFGKERYN